MSFRKLCVAAATVLATAVLSGAVEAHAAFDVTAFDGQVTADGAGTPFTQAGGHPFAASTTIDFPRTTDLNGNIVADGDLKDLEIDLPAGLVGNPTVVPRCSEDDLEANGSGVALCPLASQVGVVILRTPFVPSGLGIIQRPLFNLRPPDGVPASFGFNFGGAGIVHLDARLRSSGDYGVSIDVRDSPQTLSILGTTVTLWGTPAAPVNDQDRGRTCQELYEGFPFCVFEGGDAANIEAKPFLTLPIDCSAGPLTTSLRVRPWQSPQAWVSTSFVSHLPPAYPAPPQDWGQPQGVTGCARVPFDPSLNVSVTRPLPDAPTGVDIALSFPQNGMENPAGLGTAHLKRARVTLPEGMTINPAGAGGLAACSDAQLGLGTDTAMACPEASKVGTVTATTPLLEETLTGGVYVRSQASDDPESGAMFRVAIVLRNAERGLDIRLPGSVRTNARTGRIEATFDNNPQLPVDAIKVSFKDGPRAPLATPADCGAKTVQAELTSWAGQTVHRSSTFDVACTPGLGGFAPQLKAGTVEDRGGAFTAFALGIVKPDGDAPLSGLTMALPTGLLAQLKGNIGTQVGTVRAAAGPGDSPYVLDGRVYLEGRYDDAPFSLRVVVPAKAGPFDLGEVVVRQKIYVDPIDAHVTVVSDPIPTIVKGVPARLQRLDVDIDKPGFMINPTSCAAKTISGTLSSAAGQSVPVTNHFQVSDCGSLALKPGLALSLSGKGQTKDGAHPAISATLTQPFGAQVNLKKVRVALPLSLALDPDNANGLCEFVDGSKTTPTCPKASIVGSVTATTPILDEPLSGPVYFVKNIRKDPKTGREIRTLPKLVIPLTGQNGVKLTLTGTSNVENDHLVTTFDNIPDAPVSSFKLNVNGGKGGILTVSGADICKATQIADQQIDGQNNKNADADVYIQTPSCPLRVISKKVGKSSIKLKIGGLGAGKVTLTGRGIRKATKTISKSTVATITARRTKSKPGKVTVSFDPAGPAKARRTTK